MANNIVQCRNIDKNDFGGTLTYSFASTPTSGNLLLLFVGNNNAGSTLDSTTITGFTKVAAENGASFQGGGGVWYKWAGGSESNSYAVADTGGWNGSVIGVEVSGGAGSGDPADVALFENVLSFTTPVIKSVTTVTDHCFVFGMTQQFDQDPASFGAPSGWTLLDNSAGTRGCALWYIDKSPAGATVDASPSGGNGFPSVSYTYAIKPSGGGGGTTNPVSLSGTLTSAGALARQDQKRLAGTLTSSGELARRPGKALTGTLTSSGALARLIGKRLAGTLTSAGTLTRQTAKALSGTLTSAGGLTRQTSKRLTGTLTSAGSLAAIKTALIALSGTLTSAGSLVRRPGKALTGTLTSSGSLVRQVAKSITGTLTSTGSLVRQAAKRLAGTLTSAGTLSTLKAVLRTLTGTLSSSGALTKLTGKSVTGTLTSSGSLARVITRLLTGSLGLAGSLTKRAARRLSAVLTSAGALAVQAVGTLVTATRAHASDSAVGTAAASDALYVGASAADSAVGAASATDQEA